MELNLCSIISYYDNAWDLWEDVKERFSIVNEPKIHQLETDLDACKQAKMIVETYYGKLKVLWNELANYEQI